jgi:UDP-N-acetylmuramate--alanine ligase
MLLLAEIYPASEKPVPGVNSQNLARGIRQISRTAVEYFQDVQTLADALPGIVRPGDVVLTLGAGTITTVGPRFLAG